MPPDGVQRADLVGQLQLVNPADVHFLVAGAVEDLLEFQASDGRRGFVIDVLNRQEAAGGVEDFADVEEGQFAVLIEHPGDGDIVLCEVPGLQGFDPSRNLGVVN